MQKEIYKYPFNAKIGEENKIFLSDQICEQIVKTNYRNDQFFCLIKNKITHKKKRITISAAILSCLVVAMLNEAQPIGLTPIFTSVPEVHRVASQHFYQHAPAIPERFDKVKFIPAREMLPLMVLNQKIYINEKFLKNSRRIRGGSDNLLIDLFWMAGLLYAITHCPEEAAAFLQHLGRLNAPGLANNPPACLV